MPQWQKTSIFTKINFLKRFTHLFLAIATGLLLFAAWPVSPLTLLIFVAWTPLLWLESIVASRKKFFWLTYVTMFIWNVSTTWWIWNASPQGAIAAFLANSLLMCFPWLGFKIAKKRFGATIGYISLIAFWMCFEYIHLLDWGLSWPWLTLGNVFATHTEWIQWYSFTGTSGGTLWILLSNILVFALFSEYQNNGRSPAYFKQMLSWLLIMIVPFLVSKYGFSDSGKAKFQNSRSVVVVQPNIDPYEKVSEANRLLRSTITTTYYNDRKTN